VHTIADPCMLIGRGTSTDDGFGIAAAVLESLLVDCDSTVLCATHFHDLTTFFDTPLPLIDTALPAESRGNRESSATATTTGIYIATLTACDSCLCDCP
jgi:DNA mismatch repair ATPase MutS